MIRREIRDFTLTYANYPPCNVTLPMALISALEDAGYIPSVDYGMNMKEAERLPKVAFSITTPISADEHLLRYRNIDLRISGISAPATVYLGERELCRITEQGGAHTVSVGSLLTERESLLRIEFPYDAKTMASNVSSLQFLASGVRSPIELIAYDDAYLQSVTVGQTHHDGRVSLKLCARLKGEWGELRAVATVRSPGGKMYYAGLREGMGTLLIADPEYWWPHTLGAPYLYRVTVTLYAGGEPIDEKNVNIGLRNIELSEGTGIEDKEFSFCVNGVKFFATGVELCEKEHLPIPKDGIHTEKLLRALVRANVNYLRLPDFGEYPDEELFELCDRLGILVGIGLPLPEDSASEEGSARYLLWLTEALSAIGSHPSLAIVRTSFTEDNAIREVPGLLEERAPSAVYRNLLIADGQPLSVFDTTSSFATVRTYPSFPHVRSFDTFVPPDERNPYSRTVEKRSTAPISEMLASASAHYPYAMSMEEVIYLSELHQADSIRHDVEFLRLRRGRAMGAVIADAIDPACRISPSVLDRYGREKAALYTLRSLYSPISLMLRRDGYRVNFFVANEKRDGANVTVSYTLSDAKNVTITEGECSHRIEPGSTERVLSVDFSSQAHKREHELYVSATLSIGERVISSETVLFVPPKRFAYVDPAFRYEVIGAGCEYELILETSGYASYVFVSLRTHDAAFETNYFDITKCVPVRVKFRTAEPTTAKDLMEEVRILSVWNLGK